MKSNIVKYFFIPLISAIYFSSANALPSSWNFVITGVNHQILIQSGTPVTINNEQISTGDFIGVFFTNSYGNYQCGGYSEWTGSVTNLAAWGVDVGNDGFGAGEVFTWKIWDASENAEYFANPVYLGRPFPNQGNFVANGISALSTLTAVTVPWTYTITSSNHIILIPQSVQMTINGIALSSGDYIGVFYNSGGTLACGGYTMWNGQTTSLTTLPNQQYFAVNGMSGLVSLSASTNPVPWHYTINSVNHIILIPDTATLAIDGNPIDPGDYIGLFYDSSGTLACGGYCQWQGISTSIAAWAQDAGNDGFETGEILKWKIWKHNTDESYSAQPVYMGVPMPDQGNFVPNGMSGLLSLIYTTPVIPWHYTITGTNHSILIPSTAQLSVDGQPLETGDYIGVFYDLNGIPACGGYVEWTGSTCAVSAWGDDSQTTLKDGFASNEAFLWKVWRASVNMVYNATVTYMPSPPMPNSGYFVTNGMSGITSLVALSTETQNILFASGWSIFSTYIQPLDSAIQDVFAPITQYVTIIKDGEGNIFWPQYGVNLIGHLAIGKGYQIKIVSNQNLTITGVAAVPQLLTVTLPVGWAIIGYLRKTPYLITNIFNNITNFVIIVKDGIGNIWWPVYGVDNIGNMLPGNGYQIKTTTTVSFSYPAN
ncbi:MAG: hypothetical protein NTW49_04135 [Bacteroidia bacterium]|nr:hypothetical protein [Bacteroidia bacterium]